MMYTINHLKAAGAIYLDNIQQGFDNYSYNIVTMNQEEAYEAIKKLWILNGSDNSFADFYYLTLDDDARNKVNAVLNKKEKQYLEAVYESINSSQIIYHLDETFIGILIKLNYLEVLFSTFYFTKEPYTMWGNYNQEYIIFTKK